MPYIEQEDRTILDPIITLLDRELPIHWPGRINYVLSRLLDLQFQRDPRYDTINEMVGVLECAKQEFYRKLAAPYEDHKESINGSAYTYAVVEIKSPPREGLRHIDGRGQPVSNGSDEVSGSVFAKSGPFSPEGSNGPAAHFTDEKIDCGSRKEKRKRKKRNH